MTLRIKVGGILFYPRSSTYRVHVLSANLLLQFSKVEAFYFTWIYVHIHYQDFYFLDFFLAVTATVWVTNHCFVLKTSSVQVLFRSMFLSSLGHMKSCKLIEELCADKTQGAP